MSFNEIQFSCLLQGKYTEAGTGKSKNLAKRQAANKMIQKLRNLPMENEEDSRGRYTQEQVEAVKRIRKCKNYYEILGVSKDLSESELKKSYRKLALAFHPDKNSAPGASEAFKAVSNTYAVLSDAEKKRQYDLYGDEEPVRSTASRRT